MPINAGDGLGVYGILAPIGAGGMKQFPRPLFCVSLAFCAAAGLAQNPGRLYGTTSDGTPVYIYTLSNTKGMQAQVISYGGIVTSLTAPDRSGKYADVVLGLNDLASYQREGGYYGAIVGRYGNRIGGAQFTLEGKTYRLPKNNGGNALHGGLKGFDKRVWNAREVSDPTGKSLELTYVSKEGEEGYPGTLSARVSYTVTPDNELKIEYSATTDRPTIVNLTNHSYFNLAGAGSGDILKHQVTIYADSFTPVDQGLIPTGEIKPVKGTPFDFISAHAIGERIGQNDPQLQYGKGYDHNYVLRSRKGGLAKAAEVYDPGSGRVMEVWTTEPGVQFYTGNNLRDSLKGKEGKTYARRGALCLETQHYPDSPNKPNFPTTELKPGATYRTTTVYKFSAR
jgi:aldose 1-epimerase